MGLLAGFVLFYSVLGIPIARLADRFNRRNVVAIALAFWSAITVLCGMAHRVATLAPARIGVGESGGTPASQSIIADLFSKHQRPRARIYAIGTYLGVFLGYFIGGYNNQYYGWRMAFHTAGLPGLALAAVLWLTIQEPKRGAMAETFTPEPIGPTLDFLALQRTFVILLAGFCLTTYFPTMVAALAATSFLVGFQLGPIFAIAQTVARPSMLALALAIMLLTAAGFGQGIGPLAAGMLNNALKNDFGAQAVGLFTAFGRGHGHGRGFVVYPGGAVDSARHQRAS